MSKIDKNFNSAYADYVARSVPASQSNQNNTNPIQTPVIINPVDINQEKKIDKLLKYSGLLALFLVPRAAILSSKLTQKNIEKAKNAALQNAEIEKLGNVITQKLDETLKAIQKETPKTQKTDNYIYKALGIGGGCFLAGSIMDKINKGEKLTDDEKQQVVNAFENEKNTKWNTINNNARRIDGHEGWLKFINERIYNDLTHKYTTEQRYDFAELDPNKKDLPCYFSLLQNVEQKGGFKKDNYADALREISQVAKSYITGEAQKDKPGLKLGNTIWSVAAEYAPVKEGGLGNVPPDIQKNITALGMNLPTFLPMYEPTGESEIKVDEKGVGTYNYKGTIFNIKRAAHFRTQTCRKDIITNTPVEVYVATPDDNKIPGPLIFIRNENYFDTYPYTGNPKAEEPERMAFFSKTVYELAKQKINDKEKPDSITPVPGFVVDNKDAYEAFNAPDGMLLNDWHAAPVGALMRYKTKVESAAGKLDKDVAKTLGDMKTILICHNCDYQGETNVGNNDLQRKESSENILNTLFDCYAADIVSHAYSGIDEPKDDNDNAFDTSNVFVFKKNCYDKFVSLLGMGVFSADCVCPVSECYTDEITEHRQLSRHLLEALNERKKASEGKPEKEKILRGVTNGNDYDKNKIEKKVSFFMNHTGWKSKNIEEVDEKEEADKSWLFGKDTSIKDLKPGEFWLYGKDTSIENIMKARKHNKELFYNNFIRAFAIASNDKDKDKYKYKNPNLDKKDLNNDDNLTPLKKVVELKMENLSHFVPPELTPEELDKTPIITNGARLVTQKGFPTMAKAIEEVYKNWDKNHPDQPKPIFCLAGEDGEGGHLKEEILAFQKSLGEDGKRVVFFEGFAPFPIFMCGSDFFAMTSIFEPCGLTQGESLALGTPVVATAVGGLVNTIETENNPDKGKHQYGLLADVGLVDHTSVDQVNKAGETFAKSLDEALDIYYGKEGKIDYKTMVENSIKHFNQDWIRDNKEGPIYEYLELFGIEKDNLMSLDEIKAKKAAV